MGQNEHVRAGWYPDPSSRATLRYWSGITWTEWARTNGGPMSVPIAPVKATATPLEYVTQTFLPRAHAHGLIDDAHAARLHDLVRTIRSEAHAGEPASGPTAELTPAHTAPDPQVSDRPVRSLVVPVEQSEEPLPRSAPAAAKQFSRGSRISDSVGVMSRTGSPTAPMNVAQPVGSSRSVPAQAPQPQVPFLPSRPAPKPVRTGPTRAQLIRQRLSNELTVNGLAYLGVLLLFVGAFGLVVFAFGDVAAQVRPIAELTTATVPFLGAWILLRSGAKVAGRAVEVLAGLVVPLMGITSLVDGFPIPPNPSGIGLPIAATIICTVCAAGGALWSRTHPESGLRFTVTPTLWLAAAAATIGVGRPMPQGDQVASVTSWQALAATLALFATTFIAVRRPAHAMSAPTRTVALPGLTILGVLLLVTSLIHSTPLLTMITAAVLIATAWLCRPALTPALFDVLAPVTWAIAGVASLASALVEPTASLTHHVGLLAAVGALGFAALDEQARREKRPLRQHALISAGLILLLALSLASPQLTWPVTAMVLLWSAWRRVSASSPRPLGAVAVLAPLALLVGLSEHSLVALISLMVLGVAGTLVARGGMLRRDAADRFWVWWQRGALAVGAVWSLGLAIPSLPGFDPAHEGRTTLGLIAILTFAVLTTLSAIGPVAPAVRPWFLAVGGAVTWHLVGESFALLLTVRTGVLVTGGVMITALAHWLTRTQSSRSTQSSGSAVGGSPEGSSAEGGSTAAGSWAAAGGMLTLWAAVGTASTPTLTWAAVIGLAGLVTCIAIVAVRHDRGASPLTPALDRRGLNQVPWIASLLLGTLMVALVLRLLGALGPAHVWQFVVAGAVGLLAAGATRLPSLPRFLGAALMPASLTLAAVSLLSLSSIRSSITATATTPAGLWPIIVSLTMVSLLPVAATRASRHPGLVWVGWIAVGPAVWCALVQFDVLASSAQSAAWTFTALGALYAVGGARWFRLAESSARPGWLPCPQVTASRRSRWDRSSWRSDFWQPLAPQNTVGSSSRSLGSARPSSGSLFAPGSGCRLE